MGYENGYYIMLNNNSYPKRQPFYILSSLNLILIIFCIWEWSKSKTQNIIKALTGNKIQNIFDIVISTLFIIIGLYYKDTTTVIEGGALVTISVINILSPIKYKKS